MKALKFCFVVLFLSVFNFVLAQTPREEVTVLPQGPTIENPQVFRQDDKGFEIGMTIKGGDKMASDVIVGLTLMNVAGKSGKSVAYDTRVYGDNPIILLPGTTLVKKFYYELPPELSGDFRVGVNLYNTRGMFLARAFTEKITLKGRSDGMAMILADTCSLKIAGEKKTSYNLTQGVPLDASETLSLECRVKNTSAKALTVTALYNTYRRNMYTAVQSTVTGDPITFAPKEVKAISFRLSVPADPQAYDTVVSLSHSASGVKSNSVSSHFIVRGMSGTIQEISLDKPSYEKGETANVSFFVTGPADNFRSPREDKNNKKQTEPTSMEATFALASHGASCAERKMTILGEKDSRQIIALPVVAFCPDAALTLSLASAGKTLDVARTPFLMSPEILKPIIAKPAELPPYASNGPALVFLLLAVIILGIGIFYWRKSKIAETLVIVAVIFSSFAFLLPHRADAASVSVTWTTSDRQFTASIPQNTYAPGETIDLTGTSFASRCGNVDDEEIAWVLDPDASYSGDGNLLELMRANTVDSFSAPAAPGTHTIYLSRGFGERRPYFRDPFNAYPSLTFTVSGACIPSFVPSEATVCSGDSFTQDDGCGNVRTAFGSKTDGVCSPPPTATLTASPSSVTVGDSSTLSWTSTNADSCSAPWTGTNANAGSQSLTPATTATYTISCDGPGGTTSDSKTITVTPIPNAPPNDPIITPFAGNTNTTSVSQSFTVSGNDADSNDVRYEIDWDMDGTSDTTFPASGYVVSGAPQTISRTWPTTGNYTFQARTEDQPGLFSGWTPYTGAIMDLNFFPVSSSVVVSSENPALSWTSSNVNTCDAGASPPTPSWSGTQGTSGNNVSQDTIAADTNYTLTCANTATGLSIQKSTLVTVYQQPLVTFSTPTLLPIAPGDPLVLEWDSTNANTCTASAIPPTPSWSGAKPLDNLAGETQSPIGETTEYKIVCENSSFAASLVTKTINVVVTSLCGSANGGRTMAAPTTNLCSVTASPSAVVKSGSGKTWDWTCTNASWTHNCSAAVANFEFNNF